LKQAAKRERDWQALKGWLEYRAVYSVLCGRALAEMSRLDAAKETGE